MKDSCSEDYTSDDSDDYYDDEIDNHSSFTSSMDRSDY